MYIITNSSLCCFVIPVVSAITTIAPNATVVIYGILFGDMHLVKQMSVSETKLHNEVVIKTTPTEIMSCETFASIHLLSS